MMARMITALMAMLVAVLLVAAYAAQASEYSEGAHAILHYTGKIVGIDPVYKILTVEAGPGDAAYFEMRDNADVLMCDKALSFKDLKIGDTVNISYFEESLGGTRMATEVDTATHC